MNESDALTNSNSSGRLNFSELKRLHKHREIPVVSETDIRESFVRGSGPGGQSINKTENCVCSNVRRVYEIDECPLGSITSLPYGYSRKLSGDKVTGVKQTYRPKTVIGKSSQITHNLKKNG